MPLFTRGMSLLISNMPAYIKQPFIVRLDGPGGFGSALDSCVANVASRQPQTERFVTEIAPETCLQLLGIPPAGDHSTEVRVASIMDP